MNPSGSGHDGHDARPPSGSTRKVTPEVSLPQASPRKVSLRSRSKKFYMEAAPWFRANQAAADDAHSDAESVTSEYRGEDGADLFEAQESTDASGASSLPTALQSGRVSRSSVPSEAMTLSPTALKKSNLELELPVVPNRGADVSPLSASRSSVGAVSNKTTEADVQVSASTAGEWVNRLAALQEVGNEHAACAGRIWNVMKEIFPEVKTLDTIEQTKMKESILSELEMSRRLLEQHAQGLVGTDLAELRFIQSETKRANERLVRIDKLYAKELNALRSILDGDVKVAPREDYEPMMFLEPEERGCLLTLLEEKLQALFSEKPELELMINQKEYIRLQELFKKERLSGLERQVANFTQKLEEITNQVTLLEAENEKLAKRHAKEMRRTSSTSSPGTSSRTLQDHRRPSGAATSPTQRGSGESSARQVATPVGKPKAGRPKRGVKYSRPGREAGDSSDA
ncbi:unnamed protein product [Cladocopium goreaui]|uniref:Uncharacterized protein n=1 Tax=Cladocopium goreaui TaxID=2562237 RepID=A0A9P1D2J2_9DINO|nr:unnamed protein product [Cladocopium goreaui]